MLSEGQRSTLQTLARSQTTPVRQVRRARALLLAADGMANDLIAQRVGASPTTVRAWRKDFAERGLARFGMVRSGRGRKPTIPDETVEAIVDKTRNSKPRGETHWSCRSMAREFGVSPATVQRIWSARGLKPHLVETFKLSNDPQFEGKLVDVVGLYPPAGDAFPVRDDKSSPALDRTQVAAMRGRAVTMTHDLLANGTNPCFAALNVRPGPLSSKLPATGTEFLSPAPVGPRGRQAPAGEPYPGHTPPNNPRRRAWLPATPASPHSPRPPRPG